MFRRRIETKPIKPSPAAAEYAVPSHSTNRQLSDEYTRLDWSADAGRRQQILDELGRSTIQALKASGCRGLSMAMLGSQLAIGDEIHSSETNAILRIRPLADGLTRALCDVIFELKERGLIEDVVDGEGAATDRYRLVKRTR